ncbi:MAG: exo-alpha-sialidase [Saprospiraceae bacterium]|nr:exo-alpha-sialidase [Saprospiraceae bacterium]
MRNIQVNKRGLQAAIYLFACIGLFLSCSRKTSLVFKDHTFKNVVIDEGRSPSAPCEPSIAINPSNPNQVSAASVLNNYYQSNDGGLSWTKERVTSPYGVYGDPVIRYDYSNNVFFAHLSNPKDRAYSSEEFLDRIVVQKKQFNGSWNDGSFPPCDRKKDHDKHWLAIDKNSGVMLMTWTQFDVYGSKSPDDQSNILFSKSMDKGITWSEAKVLNQSPGDCLDDDKTTEGAVPEVSAKGNYIVVWCRDSKIYFTKSTDQGESWSDEQVIAQQVEGWSMDIPGIDRSNGFPVIKVDKSTGKFNGRIYVSFADQRNGKDNTDIWLIYSDNEGETWSKPVMVNNDEGRAHQFFHAMDIDEKSGQLFVMFYDRRSKPGTNATDVFLAYSVNGGSDFENVMISEKSFTPEPTLFFGDYNDLSVVPGQVRPIWTHQNGNTLKVKTAIVSY